MCVLHVLFLDDIAKATMKKINRAQNILSLSLSLSPDLMRIFQTIDDHIKVPTVPS